MRYPYILMEVGDDGWGYYKELYRAQKHLEELGITVSRTYIPSSNRLAEQYTGVPQSFIRADLSNCKLQQKFCNCT